MTKAASPLSVRLDAETEQRLRRLAHETGGTLSSVVREAVAAFGAEHDRRVGTGPRPYDRVRHLLGVVDRHADRSVRTGKRFRTLLETRARARRAR